MAITMVSALRLINFCEGGGGGGGRGGGERKKELGRGREGR